MKRAFALVLAMVLLVVATVGATLAYLNDKSGEVKNTFTVGNIDIVLAESKIGEQDLTEGQDNAYQLIPGTEYKKNPTVTVKAGSENCYLFVKFEENNSPSSYITYTSNLNTDNSWKQGKGTGEDGDGIPTNVWYREVPKSTSDTTFKLLKDDKITINTDVTNQNMTNAAKAELVYTAYAVQKANMNDAAAAWAQATGASEYKPE